MKDIKLEDVLPITAMQYFTHFIEPPDAKFQYLASKGHSDVEVGPWSPSSTSGMHERVAVFSTNLSSNAVVKKLTGSVTLKVTETQRYFFEKQGDLRIVSTISFGGSSLAENFSSEVEWVVHTLPNAHSEIKCNVKTEYKGFMFKGLIEKYVHQAACDSFHSWLNAVRDKITILQEVRHADQSVPNQVPYPPSGVLVPTDAEEEEDDDEDDVFYDSVEMAPPPPSFGYPPTSSSTPTSTSTSSSALPQQVTHQQQQELYRTSPPLTATLPAPFSTSHPNHVIFTAYSAGRPALTQPRALSPPPIYPLPQTTPSLHVSPLPPPITSYPTHKPQLRAWEAAASDAERRQVEDYKQRFAQMAAHAREREREWDERLLRMTQRLDAHTRRTRWFLVAIASFGVAWPGLARALLRLMTWLWPLLRARFQKWK